MRKEITSTVARQLQLVYDYEDTEAFIAQMQFF